MSQACSLVALYTLQEYSHCPSLDAPTFLCSSSVHQQGIYFRKLHLSSMMTPSVMLYSHTDILPWMKWITLCRNWAKIYAVEDFRLPIPLLPPLPCESLFDSLGI